MRSKDKWLLIFTACSLTLLALIGVGVMLAISDQRSRPKEQEAKSETPERYLDSRTGAALERTVKSVISQSGYRCDRVRSVSRVEDEFIRRVEAEDGRWVDCGADGTYGVIESEDGFKAVKR